MPLVRVPSGTIPYDPYTDPNIPAWLRKKRLVEDGEIDPQERGGRFARPLIPGDKENSPATPSVQDITLRSSNPRTLNAVSDQRYRIIPQRGATAGGDRNGATPQGIVFHDTGSEKDTIEGLIGTSNHPLKKGYGYNFVIDKDGNIHQMLPLDKYSHGIVGPDDPHRTNPHFPGLSNRNVINVGILGDGSDPTPAQQRAGLQFSQDMVQGYKMDPKNVLGHGELQSGQGGNKEFWEGTALADTFRQTYAAIQNGGQVAGTKGLNLATAPNTANITEANQGLSPVQPIPGVTLDYGSTSPPTAAPDVAASPGNSAQVSQAPSQPLLGTFLESLGFDRPEGGWGSGRKGGMPAFHNPVTIPQEDMGQSLTTAAGPEGFPQPPPPPPRTPPGMQPIYDKRRRSSFA